MPVPRQVAALSRVGVDRSIDEYASHALGGGVCPPLVSSRGETRTRGGSADAAAAPSPPWRRQSAWTVAIWAGFPFTHRQIFRIGASPAFCFLLAGRRRRAPLVAAASHEQRRG